MAMILANEPNSQQNDRRLHTNVLVHVALKDYKLSRDAVKILLQI